jgi:hypothetical protein
MVVVRVKTELPLVYLNALNSLTKTIIVISCAATETIISILILCFYSFDILKRTDLPRKILTTVDTFNCNTWMSKSTTSKENQSNCYLKLKSELFKPER